MNLYSTLLAVGQIGEVTAKNLNWIGKLLVKLFASVGSVGIAVVLFTLIVKVIVLPLDIFSRVSTKKNEFTMKRMKPQLDKLKKQYANNPKLYQAKLSAIYKKEGYSMVGMCLPTLVSLIFFWVVFAAFRAYSSYAVAVDFNKSVQAYNEVVTAQQGSELTDEEIKDLAATAAAAAYKENMSGFIWVKNIWVADTSFKKSVPTKSEFESLTGAKIDETDYNNLTAKMDKKQVNGYFILPILCMVLSFLSQWLMQRLQKTQNEVQAMEGQASTMKMMSIIMPIMFGVFSLSYSSAFTVYMIVSSLYSTLSTLLLNFIITKVLTKKYGDVQAEKPVVNR